MRQARAKVQVKSSTACFALGTRILVQKLEKASWIPIYSAEQGDIVVHTLPSGKIEDLTGALMTTIETVCTFDCPAGRIDLVQMGDAIITAHHHIQTADGCMTARQAADMGHGSLLTNFVLPRVYNLCLEGGGSIIINATATLQSALTLTTAATMGYHFEPAIDPQHHGSLTYPNTIRVSLGQISGIKCGRKHFKVNEVRPSLIENYSLRLSQPKGSASPSLRRQGLGLPSRPPCTIQPLSRREFWLPGSSHNLSRTREAS